jgi:ABC-type sugar transport system ATPase subunit
MGDRVAVLKDGVLLQVDSANDLYEYPGSAFVGEFIGSPKMNLVEGMLSVSDGTVTVEALGVRADVTERAFGRLADGVATGPVLVGIRPHDLHLASGAANESPRIPASVDVSEHTGTEVFATVDVGDIHVIGRLPRAPIPAVGDRVELVFDRDSIHLFDPESKLSLLGRQHQRERVSVPVESSQQT